MISYAPFWRELKRYGITTYQLIHDDKISSSTINKLRHNQPISTRSIDRLCAALCCDVENILEFRFDVSEKSDK